MSGIFGHRDAMRIHLGNRLGGLFPDREKHRMTVPLPAVPLLYHAVGRTGSEGQVSTLDDILMHLLGCKPVGRDGLCCPVTFDDGYASSIPAIKKLCGMGVPVVWFIPTWCREGAYLPKDWLRIVAERLQVGERLSIGGFSIRLRNPSPVYRRWLAFRINRALMLAFGRHEYLRLLGLFYGRYRSLIDVEAHAHLQLAPPSRIRSLCDEIPALEIGSHGHTHYRWDRLQAPTECHEEVVLSRRWLEDLSGRQVSDVAYPYGYRPLDRCMDIVREEYRSGFVAKPIPGDDPFLRPRQAMDGVSLHEGSRELR